MNCRFDAALIIREFRVVLFFLCSENSYHVELQLGDACETDSDCGTGLYCFSCAAAFDGSQCVRTTATPQFSIVVSPPSISLQDLESLLFFILQDFLCAFICFLFFIDLSRFCFFKYGNVIIL